MSKQISITIWIDGACIGNPGPGGYAIICDYKGKRKEFTRAISPVLLPMISAPSELEKDEIGTSANTEVAEEVIQTRLR